MPVFQYKAVDPSGVEVVDSIEASDATMVADRLDGLGYLPLSIKEEKASKSLEWSIFRRKIKDIEIIVFSKQLVTLLKAGVPLLACLEALVEQIENVEFKDIIQNIHVDIESGVSFSGALEKHENVFSPLYVNSVRAGEAGGALDRVLERLALLMEHDHETKARVKSAMRYPIIVVVSLVLAFTTLMLLVVPKFITLFSKLGVELPLPTRILIGTHHIIASYWYVVLGIVGVLYFALMKYIKTERGAYRWDQFLIALPLFGDLNLKTAMSRFARMFETLNSSGLPILQALEITSKTVGNVVVGKEIERVSYGVLQGKGLAEPLSEGKIFPPMVVRMLAIGEQSGSLDDMLLNVSGHYDMEIEYAVKNLTSLIEPILTVVMGIVVLFLALAIFMPMWNLTKLAQ